MTSDTPHARAFDLPGWPCPPRVSDIPHNHESWGFVPVSVTNYGATATIAQDELGYLWARGSIVPRFELPSDSQTNPGALVFWAETGLGLWMHRKSMRFLPSISRLDMNQPDEWLPVNETAAEWPAFVKAQS